MVTRIRLARCMKVGECSILGCCFFFNTIVIASAIRESSCVFARSFLPSDSPPCSLPGPTGAAAPPRRSSEVGPAPDLRQHEEMRMTLAKEARSSLRGEHAKRANDVETWDVLQRTHGSGVLICAVNGPDDCSTDAKSVP